MAKLPTDVSGRDARAALERVGFVFRRQLGSHVRVGFLLATDSYPRPLAAKSSLLSPKAAWSM